AQGPLPAPAALAAAVPARTVSLPAPLAAWAAAQAPPVWEPMAVAEQDSAARCSSPRAAA
ncbi:MAG TPA: hypothetical protein VK741_02305, partial [Acetobacteraceae bacterium]|nr:hypothetical protein [Acetobacteraceae bacterium]